jgi:uncharacterized protein YndB with AHSA1/START domain
LRLRKRSLVLHDEITIERPVKEVWPALFRYNEWNPYHIGAKVERICGAQDEVGDLLLEYKKTDEGFAAPVAVEIVKIVEFKKLVWKLSYPERALEIDGFVDFSLEPLPDGATHFVYNSYSEIPRDLSGDFSSEAEFAGVMTKVLQALKTYVERSAA